MNNPLVQPDPGLYIWTIATFLVLLWLLAKFAWRPLLAALERRQDAIRKSLDDAQQAKVELERLHVESRKILAEARVQADSILSQTRSDAGRLRDELKQKAQGEAAGVLKNAERQIENGGSHGRCSTFATKPWTCPIAIASKLLRAQRVEGGRRRAPDRGNVKQIEARRPS